MATRVKARTDNLREDCVSEALSIIGRDGLDKLSLREVARRLGVSHQAPYKHYPSRDHLLAEVVKRAYESFARHLEAVARKSAAAPPDLRAMGGAYVRYALSHPLEYRLMFNTTLPDPQKHPAMMKSAHLAFDMLREALGHRHSVSRDATERDVDHDALFIWSTLHGLVSIMRSEAGGSMDLPLGDKAVKQVLDRIGTAIDGATRRP